jgi:tetratricopeptide (TPR) repeat protein
MMASPRCLALLAVWLTCGACASDHDAAAWHDRARQLLDAAGTADLRALPTPTLSSAIYCEEQAQAIDGSLSAVTQSLGALYTAQGSFERATVQFRTLVQQRPDDPRGYAGLGRALAAQGRFSGAMRAFQDALRRGPEGGLRLEVYNRLGHTYHALGHLEKHLRSAEATYRASLRMDPQQADILYQLGRVLDRLERPGEALLLYRKALELAPDDTGIRVVLAAAYVLSGRREAAQALLRVGLERGPDADLHYETGRLAYGAGQPEAALASFRLAQTIDSTLTAAARYEGRILAELGHGERALSVFARLRRLLPDAAAPRISAGIILSRMGRLDEAEMAFREALELDDTGDAAVKLGGLYLHQSRLHEAERVYAGGAERHPANAELQASLGDIYLRLGVLGAALQAAEAAVRLEPEKPLWQFHLANAYERIDPEAAPAAWERYLELARDESQEEERRLIATTRLVSLTRGD